MKLFQNTTHAALCIFTVCLISINTYWEWIGAPLRPGGSWLILKVLPLVLCLPAILKAKLYGIQTFSMLVLLYMAEGVVRGMGDAWPSNVYAWICFILSWLCFAAALMYIRPYKQAYKAALKAQQAQVEKST